MKMPRTDQHLECLFPYSKEGNNIFEKIISIKYDVANNQLEKFDQYKQDIDTFYDDIMKRNG